MAFAKLTSWMLRIMILVLIGLVAYDAWMYKTPLYYIGFRWSKLRVIFNQIENAAIELFGKNLLIPNDPDTLEYNYPPVLCEV